MKPFIVFLLFLFLTGPTGCQDDPNTSETACTEEFRTIGLVVEGAVLTDYYTVRLSRPDTIRPTSRLPGDTTWYPVLDDLYKDSLRDQQDDFRFIGKIRNTIVVNEFFTIEADQCHVRKVKGKDKVRI